MHYHVLGDEDTVLGFRMAGVEGRVIENRAEAEESFDAAIGDHENGVIIISERIADLIRDRVDHYIFSEQFPLILEIPDRFGKLEGKPGLREMVNRSIGISV